MEPHKPVWVDQGAWDALSIAQKEQIASINLPPIDPQLSEPRQPHDVMRDGPHEEMPFGPLDNGANQLQATTQAGAHR
jgi:hypothetical protein